MEINLKRLHKDARIPTYGTIDSACLDLYAVEDTTFALGEVKYIECGWIFEIPKEHYVTIHARSGLACKKQLVLLNSTAIIDSDYRGPIRTYFKNIGNNTLAIRKGDRYAQMALHKRIYVLFNEVDKVGITDRNTGGFGSTGK